MLRSNRDGGSWPGLQPLFGIVTSPVLRKDGSVLQSAGYDKASGLYADFRDSFPEIPDYPTAEIVSKAKEDLLDLVGDFPFACDSHRSAWLASLLTPLACEAYRGTVGPLFLIDANVRGSGKSRLADMVSIIVTGQSASRTAVTNNDEEMRKRISSWIMDGARLVLLDNVTSLGGPVLDAAITGEIWRDRVLGSNSVMEGAMRMTWYASGNNVELLGDMPRRVCPIRLESPLEKPELRTDFKYPNLLQHVRKHRAALLTAALTLLRAYIAAGRPSLGLPPLGSFEAWSDLVRNTIVWCGLADPVPPQTESASVMDEEALSQLCFLQSLRQIAPDGTGVRAAQMLEICGSHLSGIPMPYRRNLTHALEAVCGKTYQYISTSLLGAKLRRFKGRVLGGMRLTTRIVNGHCLWSVTGGEGGLGGLTPAAAEEFEEQNENTNVSETTVLNENESTMSTSAELDTISETIPEDAGAPLADAEFDDFGVGVGTDDSSASEDLPPAPDADDNQV